MKISRTQVEKVVVSGIEHFDDITVIFEDYNEACRKTIIQTFDGAWSYQWGGLAGAGMENFFRSCGFEYLVNKLNPHDVDEKIDLRDGVQDWFRGQIIAARKDDRLTKARARELYDDVEWQIEDDADSNRLDDTLMHEVIGEEWWYELPKQENPKYGYLKKVVGHIRQALYGEDENEN